MAVDPDMTETDEEMSVTYSYAKERAGKLAWECQIIDGPLRGEYTLEKAQAILRQWGVPEEDIPR
jgi:hypothetical protein